MFVDYSHCRCFCCLDLDGSYRQHSKAEVIKEHLNLNFKTHRKLFHVRVSSLKAGSIKPYNGRFETRGILDWE